MTASKRSRSTTSLPLFPDLAISSPPATSEPLDTLTPYLFPTLVYDCNWDRNVDINLREEDISLEIFDGQLSFDFFLDRNITSIDAYVSKRKNPFLDRDFSSFAASRDGHLLGVSLDLHELGYVRIGHIVQMTSDEIKQKTGASDKIVLRIENVLESVGLGLGMKPIQWQPGTARER